jgi:hypothetical protein
MLEHLRIQNTDENTGITRQTEMDMHSGCWNIQKLKKIQEIPSELKKHSINVAILPETNKKRKVE